MADEVREAKIGEFNVTDKDGKKHKVKIYQPCAGGQWTGPNRYYLETPKGDAQLRRIDKETFEISHTGERFTGSVHIGYDDWKE